MQYEIAVITSDGVEMQGPLSLETDWEVAHYVRYNYNGWWHLCVICLMGFSPFQRLRLSWCNIRLTELKLCTWQSSDLFIIIILFKCRIMIIMVRLLL